MLLAIAALFTGGMLPAAALRQLQALALLALLFFLPVTHATAYFIYTRGGLPRLESFFGAVPGGLIETVQMGEEAGGDVFAPPADNQGWMYGFAFKDPDGHRWNQLYMDRSKRPTV